ncbi:MAG TPA: L,D-transpeptidase family protein [Novosphingobium sp.]
MLAFEETFRNYVGVMESRDTTVPKLLSGRKFLGIVIVGLAALASAMMMDRQPPSSDQEARAAELPAPKPPLTVTPAPSADAATVDDRFVIKRILPINGPIRYGEWHWDEADVPAGPIVITVDLDARVLSIFRGGYEIGASAVLLGSQEKPTPLGVFPITQKKRDHTSNLYDAPMPYMQRLTNDGITLHATKVELGYASHGCIGMPEAFAKKVFEATKLGDKVYITRGKTVGMGDSLVES